MTNYKEIAGIIKNEIDKELTGHKVLIRNNEKIIKEGIQKNTFFNYIPYQNNIQYSKSYMDGLEKARNVIANKYAGYFEREDKKNMICSKCSKEIYLDIMDNDYDLDGSPLPIYNSHKGDCIKGNGHIPLPNQFNKQQFLKDCNCEVGK